MKIFSLLFIILLFPICLFSQQKSKLKQLTAAAESDYAPIQQFSPRVRQISIKDGLSDRFVNNIFQDSRGFVWISCNYGLNRYDGKHFKVYTKETHGLKSNEIREIYEINDTLLIVTHKLGRDENLNRLQHHFSLFNPVTENVLPIEAVFKFPKGFQKASLQFVAPGLIIDIQNNIYTYETKGTAAFVLKYKATLVNYPRAFYCSPHNPKHFWILHTSLDNSRQELSFFNGEKLVFLSNLPETAENSIDRFVGLYADKEGNFYYSGNNFPQSYRNLYDKDFINFANFLHVKVNKEGQSSPFSLKGISDRVRHYHHEAARMIFLEELHIFVVPTEQHFDIFDWEGNFISRTENIYPLLSIIQYYVDDHNRIWLASADGLYLVDFNPNISKPIYSKARIDPYATPGMEGNAMRGICEDRRGDLWLGLDKGLGDDPLVRVREGRVLPVKTLSTTQKAFFKDRNTVPCYAVATDSKGMIWVTDDHYGLYQIDPETEKVNFYTYPEYAKEGTVTGYNSGRPTANRAIYIDEQQKRVWMGHRRGLSYLELTKDHLQQVEDKSFLKALGEGEVHCFHANAKGLWIGTTNGLFCYQTKDGTFKHYHPDLKGDQFFPNRVVSHIYENKKGEFWMASKGGEGIIYWNPSSKTYKQYTTKDGLPHNVTYAVYEDKFGDIWSSTNLGIFRMNLKEKSINVYLPKDGVPHIESNLLSHYQASDGTLYFGGLNGVAVFSPSNIRSSSTLKHAKLQAVLFELLDKKTGKYVDKTADFIKNPKIVLNANYQTFRLHFALLDYFAPDQVSYAYRIEGIDKDWNYTESPSINISGLPYGNYTLRIKGRGTNALWSKNELVYSIAVLIPFYKQWWFIVFALALSGLFIWASVEWRLRSLRKAKSELEQEVEKRTEKIAEQAEDLKALDKLKSRFYANISHELRTPLTLILGPLRRLLRQETPASVATQLELMERSGSKLLGLVEEILDLSKLDANKLEIEEEATYLVSFLRLLFSNYESSASYKSISMQFTAVEDAEQNLILDRKKLEKILDNLMSNALKFTKKGGTISLSVKTSADFVEISVTDTGEGIHPEDLPHIFDRFYQSSLPERKAQGGTGIGLAFSKELAAVMGGKLSVISEFGKGSTFTLKIPKKEAAVLTEETTLEETALMLPEEAHSDKEVNNFYPIQNPDANANLTVLIVEDHPDMRLFVNSIISEHYKTRLAENGQAALEILETEKIDFIVSDLMMPVMDGFQLLEKLKTDDRYRHIPVLMLTARAASEDRLFALRIGVDDYLTKPFIEEELIARIHNLLLNYQERMRWAKGLPPLVQELAEVEIKETEQLPAGEEEENEDPDGSDLQITQEDLIWLQELETFVKKTCGNNNFSVDWLAAEMSISIRQLQRRLKKVTGLTPKKYINEVRLQLARELLETQKYNTIAQVVYHVGFQKTAYFTQLFSERFGCTPNQYLKK